MGRRGKGAYLFKEVTYHYFQSIDLLKLRFWILAKILHYQPAHVCSPAYMVQCDFFGYELEGNGPKPKISIIAHL